jgi:plasminogen activator
MKKNTWVKKNAGALALLMACHTAAANDHSTKIDNLTISTSLGLLNAESQEFVYQPENNTHKLSQLDWKVTNAPIIKMGISWDALSRLTLTARGWSTLTSADGTMDDYDWLTPKQTKWSHWSHHDKTNLNYANEIDLNAKFWFLKQDNYRIGVMSGYQRSNNSWTAYGGNYNYNNGSDIGKFSDDKAIIGYKQKFDMSYFGLAGNYRYQNFELNTLLKYSRRVNTYGNDEHYDTKTSYRDSSKNSHYYGVIVDAGYYVTKNTRLFVEALWSQYSEGKGGSQMLNRTTGTSTHTPDGAGIAHQNQSIALGLQYAF